MAVNAIKNSDTIVRPGVYMERFTDNIAEQLTGQQRWYRELWLQAINVPLIIGGYNILNLFRINFIMQETREPKNLTLLVTPYALANLSCKTAVISFSIAVVAQPFQALLTQIQLPSGISLSSGLFRSLYKGFVPYALAGQKRGAIAITSKQSNREITEEEPIEGELPFKQRWLGTFFFSQADLILSNALSEKARLKYSGIISKTNFKWSLNNYWQLTKATWGSRSLAGFINFSAIGFAGDYISSFYTFKGDNLYNQLAGGATSGIIATVLTTIPNAYADRKILASKIDSGRLLTQTSFTLFSQMASHVKTIGTKKALSAFAVNFLKEVSVRSPQSALTFAIIFGMDHLIGPEPLKNIWPEKSGILSKRM